MNECCVCKAKSVIKLLNTGKQPISNRFLINPSGNEYKHSLVMGQCSDCGLMQLVNPAPAKELLSPYDWITYNEPEGHLDDLTDKLTSLPGINKDSTFLGISFKEDTTLERLNKRGFNNTRRIDTAVDLKITEASAGIETIQDRLDHKTVDGLIGKYGCADVVIARHILEHTFDTKQFMEIIQRLTKPDGYVVFEAPDCMRALETFDYSTLWEEHILYFTPETFNNTLSFGGFSKVWYRLYEYPIENSMVAIVKLRSDIDKVYPSQKVLEIEKKRAKVFAGGLDKRKKSINSYLGKYRQKHGKIAIFGAGHLACMYMNLMELKDYIELVVDDNPNKKGLFMPGSRLPIYGSDFLIKENIKLCLLSLSPESEENVICKNQAFIDKGGKFASIFPASKNALNVGKEKVSDNEV